MPIFVRFRKLEPCFSDMADFCTFWTDCRENSHCMGTSLRSVKLFFAFNVRRKAQYIYIWRSFKMLLYKSGYTGRNFVRGMPKRGTSCKCSLHLPQRTRANKESQATFEGQQTSEWKSSAIIILQMKTPENTHKSGRFQGFVAYTWASKLVSTNSTY